MTDTAQRYVDCFGQEITDPAVVEQRWMRQQFRRLSSIGIKAGRPYDKSVTVGEVARATKRAPQDVVAILDRRWLVEVIRTDGPIEEWWIFEDGE
jgi:hypothetical protein